MKTSNKIKISIAILSILSLLLITTGVTMALFNYTKLGSTENTVTTGTINFIYTENTGIGNGVNIKDAYPVDDNIGKSYTTDGYVFDFKIESTNTSNVTIPYEITLNKKTESTLVESAVKVYLTDMTSNSDTSIIEPTLYSNFNKTTIDVGNSIEKTLFQGIIPANIKNYTRNFRLRMWLDSSLDFSSGNYNNQTFMATVNVYSELKT